MTILNQWLHRLNSAEFLIVVALIGAVAFLLLGVVELAGFYVVAVIRRRRANQAWRDFEQAFEQDAARHRRMLDGLARYDRRAS